VINTDKAPTYAAALADLKKEGQCPAETLHRQVKYLNNVIEADHGKIKQLIRPVRGFKTLKTAYATIKGFEVMRALRKGQAAESAWRTSLIRSRESRATGFGISLSHRGVPNGLVALHPSTAGSPVKARSSPASSVRSPPPACRRS